jgi:type IV pilus assembly protein PilO
MAALPRIVILDSFQLSQGKGGELIGMSMQAKTYKYNGKTVEKKP